MACQRSDMMAAAEKFRCLTPAQQELAQAYLTNHATGVTYTPQELIEAFGWKPQQDPSLTMAAWTGLLASGTGFTGTPDELMRLAQEEGWQKIPKEALEWGRAVLFCALLDTYFSQ